MKKIFIALALGMVLLLAAACTPGQTKIHVNPVDVIIDVSPTEQITVTSGITSTGAIQRPTVPLTPTATVTRTAPVATATATMPVTNTSGMTETYRVTLQGGNVVTTTIPPGAVYPDQLRQFLTPVPVATATITATKPVTTTFSLTPTITVTATCLNVQDVANMVLTAPSVQDAIDWLNANYEATSGRAGTTSEKSGFKTGTGPNRAIFLWTDTVHKNFTLKDPNHGWKLLTQGSWGLYFFTEEDEVVSPSPGRIARACQAVPNQEVTKVFPTASSAVNP